MCFFIICNFLITTYKITTVAANGVLILLTKGLIIVIVIPTIYSILFIFYPVGLILSILGLYFIAVKPFFLYLYSWQIWAVNKLHYLNIIPIPEYITLKELKELEELGKREKE